MDIIGGTKVRVSGNNKILRKGIFVFLAKMITLNPLTAGAAYIRVFIFF